ncbi:STAS domain-containing protein [Herbaspirillum autotrophicum]|uniref:STAS domain-containing protein n=1 Tax=Herbaspirillum autotrophicum TaxID=180195 RepID=UPI00067C23A1|nr:STAS domain-containing protein [Herbaspirillum autotrophicum]
MPLTESTRDGHALLLISGGFTIFQAAESKPQLIHTIGQADAMLELDLQGVDEFDTAGLQLLLSLRREAAQQDKLLIFSGFSAAVMSVIGLLHLHETFGLPLPSASRSHA